jgi:hypothetical protein
MLCAGEVPTVHSAENGVAIVPFQHPTILVFYKSDAMLPKILTWRSCELVRCHSAYDLMLFRIILFFIKKRYVMEERNVLTTDNVCVVC